MGGSVDRRCQTDLLDMILILLLDLTSNHIKFYHVSGSALPSAGGSKLDNSALIDANFERMRVFAPARHLMSFDIRYSAGHL